MSRTERYRIEPDGTVVTVYTDTVDLRVVGHVHAVRASVVEWDESAQAWTARILATGERFGPFATRTEAVAAERALLATRLDAALENLADAPPRADQGTSDQSGAPLATRLRAACAPPRRRMTMPHPPAEVIDVPQDVAGLFSLLDEVDRGLAREAALTPDERAARVDQILGWFAPRYAAIKVAAAAAPCLVPWTVHVADPAADLPDPDPHPCTDCFTQRYQAWTRSRGTVAIAASV